MWQRWCLAVASMLAATSARGASIEIRCPKLAESSKSELEARAQLLLSSAKMSSVSVGIECDESRMWVIWIGGRRLQIDSSVGAVEGALDAIEDLIAIGRRERRGEPSTVPPHSQPVESAGPINLADSSRESQTKTSSVAPPSPDATKAQHPLQGGVVVGTLAEVWDSSVGLGPRFEVGVRFGGPLAFVLAEGARFGVGSSSRALALDLQWGLAYGAPYTSRSGFGVVLLGGAERVAATTAAGGWFAWRATGSLGLRASTEAGSVDLWIGPELILRSGKSEALAATDSSIPQLSAMLSLGCLFPAFGGITTTTDLR